MWSMAVSLAKQITDGQSHISRASDGQSHISVNQVAIEEAGARAGKGSNPPFTQEQAHPQGFCSLPEHLITLEQHRADQAKNTQKAGL